MPSRRLRSMDNVAFLLFVTISYSVDGCRLTSCNSDPKYTNSIGSIDSSYASTRRLLSTTVSGTEKKLENSEITTTVTDPIPMVVEKDYGLSQGGIDVSASEVSIPLTLPEKNQTETEKIKVRKLAAVEKENNFLGMAALDDDDTFSGLAVTDQVETEIETIDEDKDVSLVGTVSLSDLYTEDDPEDQQDEAEERVNGIIAKPQISETEGRASLEVSNTTVENRTVKIDDSSDSLSEFPLTMSLNVKFDKPQLAILNALVWVMLVLSVWFCCIAVRRNRTRWVLLSQGIPPEVGEFHYQGLAKRELSVGGGKPYPSEMPSTSFSSKQSEMTIV